MNKKLKKLALKNLLSQAEAGDPVAASRLGDAYREGVVTEQDWEQAFRWYTLAARAGDAEAQNNLGTLYLEGHYCAEDFQQAVFWYRKSAEQGACVAQYNLGMRYIHGQGVPVDFKYAMDWLSKSAEQGYPPAFCDLGIMHLHGEGCLPDRALAKGYLIHAALNGDERAFQTLNIMIPELEDSVLQGDVDLMFQLPWLYYKGLGEVDYKAKAWAWMLWLDVQASLLDDLACQVIAEVMEMRDQFSQSTSAKSDMRKGEKLFKSMKLDFDSSRHELAEEIVAAEADENFDCRIKNRSLDQWRDVCFPVASIERSNAKQKRNQNVIIEVGAEGGGFTLFGTKQANEWTFWCESNDWTPTLLDEPAIHRRSEDASSWDSAVALLETHCQYWMSLYPIQVHSEFRERVWAIVERRHIVSNLTGLKKDSL